MEAIDSGRATLEFGPELDAASLVAAISGSGVSVVSLTPLRESLEDFFLQQVSSADWERMA